MEYALELYPPSRKDSVEKEPLRPEIPVSAEKLPIQARIDLHGLTRDAAITETERFIRQCRRERLRKVLFIHGKGRHSSDGGVLRDAVRLHIETHPYIGETGFAETKDGGKGATWAVLRYRSR
jgi:DNA-nicking Smr family endonuclease